jgi:RNA polymerase sigma factor (TIGR02999 family)
MVYGQLRAMAGHFMSGERRDHTLQPTALVHEAYIKMVDQDRARWRDRAHFFSIAAQMMRRILVDHARNRKSQKRGSGEHSVNLTTALDVAVDQTWKLLDIDRALSALEMSDPAKARLVELKFFGGLTNLEVAGVLGCSERTVLRQWKVTKLRLLRELNEDGQGE